MNRGEPNLKAEHEDGEARNNTYGDGIGMNGVIANMPENDMGAVDGVNNSEETGLSRGDTGGTTSNIDVTFNGDTDGSTGKGERGVLLSSTKKTNELKLTLCHACPP